MTAKATLLEAIAATNRGLLSSEPDEQVIMASVSQLESLNPTPRPVESADQLNGNWRLLYTTSEDLLRIDQVPFCKLGQIYQCVRVQSSKIYNIAEVIGLPFAQSIFSVVARFEPVSERRVQVQFERSIVGLQRLIGYHTPSEFINQIEAGQKFTAFDFKITSRDRQGWLDITYLDQDLRIGRGNVGSIFILAKE
jgi:hypothetical protein